MPAPRVFLSSTAYDLGPVRDSLRAFIAGLGFQPVLSDYSDVLYDPRVHTHTSCVREVASCDMLILVVGSRFGGDAVPESLAEVDFSKLDGLLEPEDLEKAKYSITQLEVFRAIASQIPIFVFVSHDVWADHRLYEKNKAQPFAAQIAYPSIQQPGSAKYIFEFLNFLRLRGDNNALMSFRSPSEIEQHLRQQWSAYFQRLLSEERSNQSVDSQIDWVSKQISDLREAVLSAIPDHETKQIARGVARYRLLVEFLSSLPVKGQPRDLVSGEEAWEDLLVDRANVMHVQESPIRGPRALLVQFASGDAYEYRLSYRLFESLKGDWADFIGLSVHAREVVFDTLAEAYGRGRIVARKFTHEELADYLAGEPLGFDQVWNPAPAAISGQVVGEIMAFLASEFPIGAAVTAGGKAGTVREHRVDRGSVMLVIGFPVFPFTILYRASSSAEANALGSTYAIERV